MNLAKKAHIDAFALNVGYGDRVDKLQTAFDCAQNVDFKLFSFDYRVYLVVLEQMERHFCCFEKTKARVERWI